MGLNKETLYEKIYSCLTEYLDENEDTENIAQSIAMKLDENKLLNRDRLEIIALNVIGYLQDEYSANSSTVFLKMMKDCGITEEELISLGWEDYLNEHYKNKKDEPDIEI